MTAEQKGEQSGVPDWAAQERDHDLAWIGENVHVFWPLATENYNALGRGAVAVITMVRMRGKSHPMGYVPASAIAEWDDEDTARIVRDYDPKHEFVVFLIKPDYRTSTYRIRPAPGSLAKLQ